MPRTEVGIKRSEEGGEREKEKKENKANPVLCSRFLPMKTESINDNSTVKGVACEL